mgnify:FL=1
MNSAVTSSRIDVATALHSGARPYQEDCIIADFPIGRDSGFAVLADGMGAHASGDLASKLIVGRVFGLLKTQIDVLETDPDGVQDTLLTCVEQANNAIRDHVRNEPDDRGMGSTLVVLLLLRGNLYWASVGDSPLYVARSGELIRLNEDHSMAPRIKAMVAAGQLSAEKAAMHPDRNALTSAIFGAQVARVDCPATPFEMQDGDTIILSSDGLQSLRDEEILKTVRRHGQRSSHQLTEALLEAALDLRRPEQDNISVIVGKYAAVQRPAHFEAPQSQAAQNSDIPEKITDVRDLDVEEASDDLLEALSL